MKKVNVLILSLAVFLTVSCGGKEEPEPKADPVENVARCQVIRRADNIYDFDFQYDSNKKLVRIDKIMRANPSWSTYQTLEYNADGKISKVHYFGSGTAPTVRTILFDYNPAGLLSQRSYAPNGQSPGYVFEKFEYNAAGQVSKKEELNPTEVYTYGIFSHLPENVIKEETFVINNGVTYPGGFNEWRFSAKKHPLGSFGFIDNEIYFHGFMSENELIGYAPNGQISQGSVTSYQYDADNYTIKEISVAHTGQSYETTYSYNCQ